jgi:hypothetical protein
MTSRSNSVLELERVSCLSATGSPRSQTISPCEREEQSLSRGKAGTGARGFSTRCQFLSSEFCTPPYRESVGVVLELWQAQVLALRESVNTHFASSSPDFWRLLTLSRSAPLSVTMTFSAPPRMSVRASNPFHVSNCELVLTRRRGRGASRDRLSAGENWNAES